MPSTLLAQLPAAVAAGALLLVAAVAEAAPAEPGGDTLEHSVDGDLRVPVAPPAARQRWRGDRFGLFIHWGPISQLGKQLSHSRNSPSHRPGGKPYKVAPIPPEVYDVQYKTFNPVAFDPDALVQLAQRAGMRYLVFTAKHHAGFSMFDSAVTDYDIMSAPYGKDILKELEQACRRHGFQFGFYYSPRDWHHPDCDSEHHDRYIRFYKAQMEELLQNYGSIYEIFFDGLGPGEWGNTAAEVMQRIRELQPQAIVNDRGGTGADFYTPEHTVSYFNRAKLWETCQTITGQWGYNPDTHAKPLSQLLEILLYAWGADGNVLLNIGPRGDGSLNPEEVERLQQIGDWWQTHGELSIRGSRGGPYLPGPWGVSTCKGRHVYLHLFRWPSTNEWSFPALPGRKVVSARLLVGGSVEVKAGVGCYLVSVPPQDREPLVTTIDLELDGDAVSLAPLPAQESLTWKAKLTSSHDTEHLAHLVDRDAATWWEARLRKGERDCWIEAAFDRPETIGSVVTARGEKWAPKHTPHLQVPSGRGGWRTVFTWKAKWEPVKFLPEHVTTDRVRLLITDCPRYVLTEFELYPPME